jgi:hypothetical protein
MDKKLNISFDLDGTLNGTDSKFFQVITHLLYPQANIYILTSREPGTEPEIQNELSELNILYDKIIITDEKTAHVKKLGITVVFENEDEQFQTLPKEILVLKVREDGNYNYKTGRWIGSKRTVEII